MNKIVNIDKKDKSLFDIAREQQNQQQVLIKEKECEVANMHVITMNLKDIPTTELGKKQAGSIGRQLELWLKTLTPEGQDDLLFMVNLEDSIERFREYVIDKQKKKDKKEWEEKFHNTSYIEAVKGILTNKIYSHKAKRGLFFSGLANNKYQEIQLNKNNRGFAHETANAAINRMVEKESFNLDDKGRAEFINEFINHLTVFYDERARKYLPSNIDQKFLE